MRFDTVFSFAVDPREALEEVRGAVQALYPDYTITVSPDVDLSD